MRKRIALIAAVSAAAVVLSACGGGSTGGGSTGKTEETKAASSENTETKAQETQSKLDPEKYAVKEPITIQWWHAFEEQYTPIVEQIVSDFNSSQDLITVEPTYVGSYGELNEAVVAANAAGSGLPAITIANTPYTAEYSKNGLTEDLTPYIEADGWDIDDFGDGLIKASSYEGKQTTLPFLISTQVMFYNKDMAKEKGVTIPEKWSDMESFLTAASELNADGTTGVYGTVIPGWDQWYFETFYLNNGVKIINDDQKSTDLNGDAAKAITQNIRDWSKKGYLYLAVGEDGSSQMRQNFIDKKAFSVLHTSSLYDTYVEKCDFEVGMAWFPGGDTKYSEIGGNVLLIPSKNDQATKNAAWQFMKYLESKEVNMLWASKSGYMPTRKSVQETEEGVKFLEQKPEFKVIFDNLDLINPRIQHAGWNQLATIWKNYLAEIVIEDVDMDQKLDNMAQEIDEVLEDSGT